MSTETDALADLVTFARYEQAAGDIEPWAAVIGAMRSLGRLDDEQALWVVKLYNAYDDLESAWRLFSLWPSPRAWTLGADRSAATRFSISRERRNLLGGRILTHLDSYVASLDGRSQLAWLRAALPAADPHTNFLVLMPYLRRVWGVGRQTGFEWAEFVAKVLSLPVETTDAQLWESTGPRLALQRLYGNPDPTLGWLNARAAECRSMLAAEGVSLSWWDFETVICDFNVMRNGRYYPGQHIAMIRAEIEALPDPHREHLREALTLAVPEPWCHIPGGVDKALARRYRDTGVVHTPDMTKLRRTA